MTIDELTITVASPTRHPRPLRRCRVRVPSRRRHRHRGGHRLDVLDPETFASVGTPEADGRDPAQLVSAVRALTDRYPLAGLGITGYEPGRASDRAVLAELIPALLAGAR